MGDYEYRNVRGHIEVYKNGEFILSADSMREAYEEIREMEDAQRGEGDEC